MKQGKLLLEWKYEGDGDSDYYSDILLEVSSIIRKKSFNGYWYCRVENFGWNKMSGYSYIETFLGKEFMAKVLPECECTWKIFNYGKGIMIQNWHHDSNTGDEKYYCMPISYVTFQNKSYKGGA